MASQNPSSSPLSNEDRELFRDAVVGVRPLKTTGRLYFRKKTPARRIKKNNAEDLAALTDPADSSVTSEQIINFFKPGIQHRVFKKPQITASLDLHGETRDSAKIILTQFIQHCVAQHHRFVRIIHGKGHNAILKNQLSHWLPQFPEVLAFQSALPQDGGAGALYVLLRIHNPVRDMARRDVLAR